METSGLERLQEEALTRKARERNKTRAKQGQRPGLGDYLGNRRGGGETGSGTTAEGPSNVDVSHRYPSRSIGVTQGEKQ